MLDQFGNPIVTPLEQRVQELEEGLREIIETVVKLQHAVVALINRSEIGTSTQEK